MANNTQSASVLGGGFNISNPQAFKVLGGGYNLPGFSGAPTVQAGLSPLAQAGTSSYSSGSTGNAGVGFSGFTQSQRVLPLALNVGTPNVKDLGKNPLADIANWATGGRMAAPGAGSATGMGMMWPYLLGGAVVLFLVARKKGKK